MQDETKKPAGRPQRVEQPPILDEEDDAILDRIWDEIGRQRREERARKAQAPRPNQ